MNIRVLETEEVGKTIYESIRLLVEFRWQKYIITVAISRMYDESSDSWASEIGDIVWESKKPSLEKDITKVEEEIVGSIMEKS